MKKFKVGDLVRIAPEFISGYLELGDSMDHGIIVDINKEAYITVSFSGYTNGHDGDVPWVLAKMGLHPESCRWFTEEEIEHVTMPSPLGGEFDLDDLAYQRDMLESMG